MQTNVDLIWNKGIAALCDRRFPDEFPDGENYAPVPAFAGALCSSRLPDNLIANPAAGGEIAEGELVWVRLSWLKSFARQVLPRVRANFVLVTGDSDSSVPSELGPEARAVLECPQLVHWYTQNYDGSMPTERISPLPIGIDFHTLSERRFWGEGLASPVEQEQTLLSIANNLPALAARLPGVYVDFGWQRGFSFFHYRRYHPLPGTRFHEDRRAVANKVRGNDGVFMQSGPLPRSEMWRRRGEYAFVLSPHGMGLDCLRTWESLALGHIVLAPSSSLDPLYADLPVVPLKSWSEITPENLERWLSLFPNGGSTHPKLRSSFWINEIRQRAQHEATPALPWHENANQPRDRPGQGL